MSPLPKALISDLILFLDHLGIHTQGQFELESSPGTQLICWLLANILMHKQTISVVYKVTYKAFCLRAEGPTVPEQGTNYYINCL